MKKIIELLEAVNRMDSYKMNDFFGKLFGYITLYIAMICALICILASILK